MRNVVYAYNVSLDGYVEGPDGSFAWGEPPESLHRYFNGLEAEGDVHIYGRRMWETMGFWKTADKDESLPEYYREFARAWQQAEHIVASRTLDSIEGARVIKDDFAGEIARLKNQPGKDIDVGGASMARTLMEQDLIDEYIVVIYPILVGGGKPMFAPIGKESKLELIDTRTFDGGIVLLHYRKA